MSRWHHQNCRDPVIVVIESVPSCKSCGGVFSLDGAIALQATGAGPCQDLPADEPYGQMNLWWPPSVQYTKTACGSASQTFVQELETTAHYVNYTPSAVRAAVYGQTLPEGSFRLACLHACQDPSNPVHLDLETYRHSHRPDYETVSYVWGGEAGDSAPSHPIFIGKYWDAFLQTENCYELLRFARPGRGVRWLWVDAVCINQEDVLERAAQVAMMHKIYSECLRCLVFLGPDVVQWHGNQLPGRQGLHELVEEDDQDREQTTGIGLQRLLKDRRYFSRVWVVQELILSPQVIVPIGDTIYWADHTTKRRIQEASTASWDWDATVAPWLQHVSQERFSIQTACESLLLTRHTRCSDPRDRLFGLLGLLDPKRGPDAPLQPNYALSNQHIWLGLFAYSILKDAAVWLLYNAAGHKATASAPSWAPSWKKAATWSNILCPDVNSDNIPLKLLKSRRNPSPTHESYIVSEASGMRYFNDFKSPAWRQDISVDAQTGALLRVRVMLLFTFLGKPKVIESMNGLTIFHCAENGSVEIACREPLDHIIQPYTDQLFMLRIDSSIVFLVLRDLGTKPHGRLCNEARGEYMVFSQPSRYRLIAACPAIFFRTMPPHYNNEHSGPTPMCISVVQRTETLQDTINKLRKALNWKLGRFVIFAPFVCDQWGLLGLYWKGPKRPGHSSRDQVLEGYLACLPPACAAKFQEAHVVLRFEKPSNMVTTSINDWLESAFTVWCNEIATESERSSTFWSPYIDWEWSLDGENWQSFANWSCTEYRRSDFEGGYYRGSCRWDFRKIPQDQTGRPTDRVHLRAPTDSILKCANDLSQAGIKTWAPLVTNALGIRSLDEFRSIVSDTTKDWSYFRHQLSCEEYNGTYYFDRDYFAICGQTWTVDIV